MLPAGIRIGLRDAGDGTLCQESEDFIHLVPGVFLGYSYKDTVCLNAFCPTPYAFSPEPWIHSPSAPCALHVAPHAAFYLPISRVTPAQSSHMPYMIGEISIAVLLRYPCYLL